MTTESLFTKEFHDAVVAATRAAREETLRAGVPVFNRDAAGIDFMQMPDGRRFQIRYIPNATDDNNYEIVRQLQSAA